MLGNFSQAFTHVGLINAALTLAQQRGEVPPEACEEPTGAVAGGRRV